MKYIKKYDTRADYNAAAENLEKPNLVLIESEMLSGGSGIVTNAYETHWNSVKAMGNNTFTFFTKLHDYESSGEIYSGDTYAFFEIVQNMLKTENRAGYIRFNAKINGHDGFIGVYDIKDGSFLVDFYLGDWDTWLFDLYYQNGQFKMDEWEYSEGSQLDYITKVTIEPNVLLNDSKIRYYVTNGKCSYEDYPSISYEAAVTLINNVNNGWNCIGNGGLHYDDGKTEIHWEDSFVKFDTDKGNVAIIFHDPEDDKNEIVAGYISLLEDDAVQISLNSDYEGATFHVNNIEMLDI